MKICLNPIRTEGVLVGLLVQQSSLSLSLSLWSNKAWTHWPGEQHRVQRKDANCKVDGCSYRAMFWVLFYVQGCGCSACVCARLMWYMAVKVDRLSALFMWNGCWGSLCVCRADSSICPAGNSQDQHTKLKEQMQHGTTSVSLFQTSIF